MIYYYYEVCHSLVWCNNTHLTNSVFSSFNSYITPGEIYCKYKYVKHTFVCKEIFISFFFFFTLMFKKVKYFIDTYCSIEVLGSISRALLLLLNDPIISYLSAFLIFQTSNTPRFLILYISLYVLICPLWFIVFADSLDFRSCSYMLYI